ncbi:MAG: PaaI family thioesterase [Ottowia sp.]|nr:PaaI family thioesterase [Ottowia sp.]
MTLLDISMAAAAMSADDAGQGAVTIEMKTSFMRAIKLVPGQTLVGRGKLLRRTRKMAFVEARILDADGEFSAHATGTFK